MLSERIFWLAGGIGAFVYAGYPLVLVLLRLILARPIDKRPIEPTVSLLIAAHNEADVIEAKIRNALALDYPIDRLDIAIASDGSTDRTVEIAAGLADGDRIRVFAYPARRGKVAVSNDTIPYLRGDVVVFSDATGELAPDALRRLVACLADPAVGAVSGVYRVKRSDAATLGVQEQLYWRYETFLKTQESALGSTLGAHGQLYAIRRALYPFPSPDTINDDYVIPLRVVQRGYRVVYETQAIVYEDAREMEGFSRRIRIMAGNVEQLAELPALLHPLQPLPLFCFLVHKAGRLLVPPAMLLLAISNLLLLRRPLYRWLGALQGVFYTLAALGAIDRLKPGSLRLPYYFCMLHAAAFPGLYYALRKRRGMVWKRG